MKILHSSDWHLGHQLYGYDRLEEQEAMLCQIEKIVATEQPDALLVSGDVFHNSQPSNGIQGVFADKLIDIHEACPSMTIIVTAGNHDSGTRHEIYDRLWKRVDVHVVGTLDREHPENHIINIDGKGIVIAVPYVNSRFMRNEFYQQLLDMAAEQNHDKLPVVMMAHTTVMGVDWTGHDERWNSDLTVGSIDALSLEDMGQGYDYLALGHIHLAQNIKGSQGRARYSGTPLPVSFDERYHHSVTMVEIEHNGDVPVLREIEIENLRPLVSLPSTPRPWKEAFAALTEFEPVKSGTYIRLNVLVDSVLPPKAKAEAIKLCEEKGCRFCLINSTRPEKRQSTRRIYDIEEIQKMEPIKIAQQYANDASRPWNEDMTAMFEEVVSIVNEEIRETSKK